MKCPYCKGTGEIDPKTTGEVIKLLRISKGWNQKTLGKKSGLSTGLLSGVEGDRNITVTTLKRLAKALNCKASDLLPF